MFRNRWARSSHLKRAKRPENEHTLHVETPLCSYTEIPRRKVLESFYFDNNVYNIFGYILFLEDNTYYDPTTSGEDATKDYTPVVVVAESNNNNNTKT